MTIEQTLQVLIRCTPEAQDALSQRLFNAGAGGVEERPYELVVYTDSASEAALFERTARDFQRYLMLNMPDWQVESIEITPLSSNWQRLWREALETVQLTERFSISPLKEGEIARKHAANELVYRPEASFGSGSHPSTRLMARSLEALAANCSPQTTILDVGTGNGVLCLLALALGLHELSACDTSEIALDSTRHNLELNGYFEEDDSTLTPHGASSKRTRGVRLYLGSADCTEEHFQLVLANIESYILREIASELVARTATAGQLLLSGILTEQREEMITLFSDLGLKLQSESSLDGWVCLQFIH